MSVRRTLVALRAWLARCLGPFASRSPRLERWFVAAGASAARHSRRLGGLYWFAHLDLAMRLRASGNIYRRLAVGPVSLWLDVTDHTGKLPLLLSQSYEPGLIRHLSERLRPGTCSSTSAAHIGLFSGSGGASDRRFRPGRGVRALIRRPGNASPTPPIGTASAERIEIGQRPSPTTLPHRTTVMADDSVKNIDAGSGPPPMLQREGFSLPFRSRCTTLDGWLRASRSRAADRGHQD